MWKRGAIERWWARHSHRVASSIQMYRRILRVLQVAVRRAHNGGGRRRCRTYGIAIPVYYAFGMWAYNRMEDWAAWDVFYYLTVTATTVGCAVTYVIS